MDDTTRVDRGGGAGLLAGRYEVRDRLGHGGMADVMRALDHQLDREVAVKILHARYADDPAFLARFRREAQAAASLSHPNVVAVYDADEHDGRPFIVMELVQGRSLSQVLATERLTVETAVRMAGDAALGIHYAHERGLIHRDVKPGNILVADDGQVKVTDFGIARAVNAETVTQTASVFGTAAYIAPEQAQGSDVDRRTDVYALGCVLYELLTGQQPFLGDSAVSLAYKHVASTPTPPSSIAPEVPAELDAVVLKALAKDPAARYQSARELHSDLQRVTAGLPVAAPAIGAWAGGDGASATGVMPPAPAEAAFDDPADDPPEEAPSRRGLAASALVLLVVGLFALGALLLASLLDAGDDVVPVRNVLGQTPEVAEQLLENDGLETARHPERVHSDEYEAGTVAETEPEPGTEVSEGSEVVLYISDGPEMAQVPEIIGLPEDEALALLEDRGIEPGERRTEVTDEHEEGAVLDASPAPGEEVPVGSALDFYVVAVAPDLVPVPTVLNAHEDDAREQLAEACEPEPCFSVAVEYEPDDTVEEDHVIRQDPRGGEEAEPGSTVELTVSTGPETVDLPDVENQPEDQAISRLEGLCDPEPCVRVRVDRAYSDDIAEGRVITQNPAPNESVEIGSTVTIVVSRGVEPDDNDDDDGGNNDGNDGNDGGDDDNDDHPGEGRGPPDD